MKKILNKKVQNRIEKKLAKELNYLEGYLRESITSDDVMLQTAALGLIEAGGKRLRPALAYLAARLWQAEADKLLPLLAALELIHTGSLVHDDIIDGARLRRGKPTVSYVHGNAAALYVGDYLIGRALELISVYQDERLNFSLNRTIMQMCLGELKQERDFFRLDQSYHDYFRRIRCKTALLFAGSCEGGALLAGAEQAGVDSLWRWGYNLGMAFQIIDDLLDLAADETEIGKPTGNDLRQGNLSLAVLFALRQEREQGASALARRLAQLQGGEQNALPEALELVRQSGGLAYAADMAGHFLARCEREQLAWPPLNEQGVLRKILTDFQKQARELAAAF